MCVRPGVAATCERMCLCRREPPPSNTPELPNPSGLIEFDAMARPHTPSIAQSALRRRIYAVDACSRSPRNRCVRCASVLVELYAGDARDAVDAGMPYVVLLAPGSHTSLSNVQCALETQRTLVW